MDENTPAEPYIIKGRDALYSITRQDLIEEYKEAVNNYREAKRRVMAIRYAVRGLSMLTRQAVPSDIEFGPILPEEREALHRMPHPDRPNLMPRAQLQGRAERKGFDHRPGGGPITDNKPDATK